MLCPPRSKKLSPGLTSLSFGSLRTSLKSWVTVAKIGSAVDGSELDEEPEEEAEEEEEEEG